MVKTRGETELSLGKCDHRSLFQLYNRNSCDSAPLVCLELAWKSCAMINVSFQGASGGSKIENTKRYRS